jgi:hypothetical protein
VASLYARSGLSAYSAILFVPFARFVLMTQMGKRWAVEGEYRDQGGYAQDECLEERTLGLKGSINLYFSVLSPHDCIL